MQPLRTGLVATALLLAAGPGCASRTLPLPPPEVTHVSAPDAEGRVTVAGFALEGAAVGVVNERTLGGVVVTSPEEACGSACPWEATLEAEVDDPLRVWQFFDTRSSIEVVVPGR